MKIIDSIRLVNLNGSIINLKKSTRKHRLRRRQFRLPSIFHERILSRDKEEQRYAFVAIEFQQQVRVSLLRKYFIHRIEREKRRIDLVNFADDSEYFLLWIRKTDVRDRYLKTSEFYKRKELNYFCVLPILFVSRTEMCDDKCRDKAKRRILRVFSIHLVQVKA